MLVPDPRRSLRSKMIDRLLNTEALFFDKIGADEEAGTVEAVVAVDTY